MSDFFLAIFNQIENFPSPLNSNFQVKDTTKSVKQKRCVIIIDIGII